MPLISKQGVSFYEYKFVPTFEETNVVGNIYFANYVVWQGKCREMFLHEYVPEIIEEINNGLLLITLDVSIKFYSQLFAFDNVVMHMFLKSNSDSRMVMNFMYFKEETNKDLTLVAEGHQSTLSMKNSNGKPEPVAFPEQLFEVLNIR